MMRDILLSAFALVAAGASAQASTCEFIPRPGSPEEQYKCTGSLNSPFTIMDHDSSIMAEIAAGAKVEAEGKKETAIVINSPDSSRVFILNRGAISSKRGRAIHNKGHREGTNSVIVDNYGSLLSAKVSVQAGSDSSATDVRNKGTIEATDDRALRLKATGSSVYNSVDGIIRGTKEVVEAREGFTLDNRGLIELVGGADDEDAVQFASGKVHNTGTIKGSDDGIDLDEGSVTNGSEGKIISTGDNGAGIDVDAMVTGVNGPDRRAKELQIHNYGSIVGHTGILSEAMQLVDDQQFLLSNGGTIEGRSGVAVDLTRLNSKARIESTVNSPTRTNGYFKGDVLFGDHDDVFAITDSYSGGDLSSGIIDGGKGINTVDLSGFAVDFVENFSESGGSYFLSLRNSYNANILNATFKNFQNVKFYSQIYSSSELVELIGKNVAPVPLPASILLMLGGFGGLASVRRRTKG